MSPESRIAASDFEAFRSRSNSLTIWFEGFLQRLFSTFANGWPGVGLLLQRILVGAMLVRFGIICLTATSVSTPMIPQILGACAGIFFLVGLWTPVAGTLIALVELWIAATYVGDPSIPIMLATLGGTAAMIGPGAWSIDARLFGRKHIEA
jgi:putative oxidoreductase